jgi:hypothetical protein
MSSADRLPGPRRFRRGPSTCPARSELSGRGARRRRVRAQDRAQSTPTHGAATDCLGRSAHMTPTRGTPSAICPVQQRPIKHVRSFLGDPCFHDLVARQCMHHHQRQVPDDRFVGRDPEDEAALSTSNPAMTTRSGPTRWRQPWSRQFRCSRRPQSCPVDSYPWRWRDICAELAVTPKHTRPCRPQTNGKVERFHLSLAADRAA